MKTEQMIEELHKIANKHKNDVVGVGELNLHAMCIDVAKRLQELLDKKSRISEWIPCNEKLPEEESLLYWTTHEDGSVVLHGYTKRNGFIYNWEVDDLEKRKRQGDVIAWTPIFQPEPYKGE